MLTVKNNLWKLFYIIIFGMFVILMSIMYAEYHEIKSRYFVESENYAQIMATTVKSSLEQEELVLDLMSIELSKDDYATNTKLFDKLMLKNRSLIGIAFIDKDGSFIYASSNINVSKAPNMLKLKTQHYAFEKTLKSTDMVVGRTYYFKPLKFWILPIRKTLRDANGKILGVLATGVKLGSKHNALGNLNIDKSKNVMLATSNDDEGRYYYLYNNYTKYLTQKEIYTQPIPDKIMKKILNLLKTADTHINSIQKLKTTDVSAAFIADNRYGENVLFVIRYIKKYKIWLVVSSYTSTMYKEFYVMATIFIFIFIVGLTILYFLFNYITKAEQIKKDELRFHANHDELTKLPNRQYLYKYVDIWREEHESEFNVLYLDLDNFKNINDKYGHIFGDKILVEVAKRLKSFFHQDDMLIRQGGDEFIVLKKFQSDADKNRNLKLLIQTITKPYYIRSKEFRIGLSVGISTYPKDAVLLEDLLSFADIAMYEAKKTKNSYSFFSHFMKEENLLKTDMEEELRGAVEHLELSMVYQPQIKADGSLHGVEALVRWNNDTLGNVGPDKFIPIAEDTGLIIEIGDFITATSLKEIHTLQKELNITFELSINISVIQFMESDFVNNLIKDIDNIGIDKSLITLEITETLSIDNLDIVLPILETLKKQGISVSLDDFGTGYSSLSILKKLPINELKIDKSFIDDILYDESAKALVNSIINIGKNFKMFTLAEGTENIEQVEMLKNSGCDIFQGYYFSKPLTLDNLKIYLTNKTLKI